MTRDILHLMTVRRAGIAVVLGVGLALGACTPDPPTTQETAVSPTYTPVPDEQLFTQIAGLDGVADATLSFEDSPTTNNTYVGRLIMADTVTQETARDILDHAYAILRQGRPQAHIAVRAESGHTGAGSYGIGPAQLGLSGGASPALKQRYGPQPGDGTPPSGD